ncbi:rhodanese-like domain-containing protein [Desulfogranum mediterraneum]|uniref:rhodanese-like domain-containing protein n=1 Tax=Desulfogranum mediterraneum TaxID=160661 RepID=UPI0004095CB9|nr:rhodanese-like domain-containing protein [Desulfogranum mediterraneum]
MQWRQFLTPVRSLTPAQTDAYLKAHPLDSYTLLDVRQAKEYQAGHLAGAKLIPVGELDQRLEELDPGKPILIY